MQKSLYLKYVSVFNYFISTSDYDFVAEIAIVQNDENSALKLGLSNLVSLRQITKIAKYLSDKVNSFLMYLNAFTGKQYKYLDFISIFLILKGLKHS